MNIATEATGLRNTTIAALLLTSAQAPLGSTLIAVALPSIGTSLNESLDVLTSLLVTSYLVVSVVGQGPGGKISDLLGHSAALWLSIGLYAAAAILGLVAPNVAVLGISRCMMAGAGALAVPATLALLRIHVGAERRGRVFGLFGATMGFSAAIGPVIGGEIVDLFDWRAIFLASLPFLAVSSLLLKLWPPPKAPGTQLSPSTPHSLDNGRRRFDYIGVALLAASLTMLVYAVRMEGVMRLAMCGAAIGIGVAFVLLELSISDPVINPRLFRNSVFAAGTGIIALQNFAMYGLLFQLPQFFERFRGIQPRAIGYMLFAMMIGMVVAAPIGGRLTDWIGARLSAFAGSLVLMCGSLLLCNLLSYSGSLDVLAPLLLFGVGIGLCSAPSQSAAMSAARPHEAGMAAGASSTMRYLGGICSMLMLSVILGDDATTTEARHQFMTYLFAAAVALSILTGFFLPRRRVVTKL